MANSPRKESNDSVSLEREEIKLNSGLLGFIFGDKLHAPSNISGMVLVFLLGVSIYGTIFDIHGVDALDIWHTTGPIISLVLGYLFGKS
ncbi:hypothetical protein [Microbulbifer sp. GL-2]|uniref:hypothetical protein n=1 Tax=Microbulbifer sp. GL-2 TaxID=2591606 RepID=UPI001162DA53|nr:hypothetical protein [Microbulbifer sp. GL-2]BBM02901.1 hypothetical protein GL2_29750 [Microbulbifer sp. GL-2]